MLKMKLRLYNIPLSSNNSFHSPFIVFLNFFKKGLRINGNPSYQKGDIKVFHCIALIKEFRMKLLIIWDYTANKFIINSQRDNRSFKKHFEEENPTLRLEWLHFLYSKEVCNCLNFEDGQEIFTIRTLTSYIQ